jgi:hypothetical protein
MTTAPTPQELLDLALPENDSGASTVRGYLVALLTRLWQEDECFSGKRPFGNGSWQSDIYDAMAKAGIVAGDHDPDEDRTYIRYEATPMADELILAAIKSMGDVPVTEYSEAREPDPT